MTKNINFLTFLNSEAKKSKKSFKLARIVAICSLILVVLLSVLVYYLSRVVYPQALKTERASLLKNLSSLRSKEAKLAVVANRTENASELINKRVDYSKIISKFFQKKPSEINIDSLKIDKKTIILTFSSNSLLPINEFIDGLIELGSEKAISALVLDSLSTSESRGIYSVSLTSNL